RRLDHGADASRRRRTAAISSNDIVLRYIDRVIGGQTMRQVISDPTAGERARNISEPEGRSLREVDPTDPRYRMRAETDRGPDLPAPTRRRPVGHVYGPGRGEPLPRLDPSAPVLRLSGFRRFRRGK